MPIFDTRSRVLRAAFAAACAGLVVFAAQEVTSFGGAATSELFETWIYTAIELAAVGICASRALARRERRVTWALVAAFLATWTAGDATWTFWIGNEASPPFPSVADAFYLMGYPLVFTGLIVLIRRQFSQSSATIWLDGLVAGVTLAAVAAALIFPSLQAEPHADTAAAAVSLAYLMLDLLLLVFIAVAFSLSGWRPDRAWILIAAGMLVLAGADLIYLYREAVGDSSALPLLNSMWPASMLLFAAAAWQPASRARRRTGSAYTVALPALFGLISLVLLVAATQSPVTLPAVLLATAALSAAGLRASLTYMENVRMLVLQTREAVTDALTGLGNRRLLMDELIEAVESAGAGHESTLVFFDLNGFKHYNDSFGHAAGDQLLARLGAALHATVAERGAAYRLGGDEFCVLLRGRVDREDPLIAAARAALSEDGGGFSVSAACGVVSIPGDADTITTALGLADRRMYREKATTSRSGRSQIHGVLTRLLGEREPSLGEHICDVGELAVEVGRRLNLDEDSLDELRRAAELHDLGKVAIPDRILHKPGPLDQAEWHFVRQHTLIGERILNAAPSLGKVARLVRSSHERWDGDGYPDRIAGRDIPLGSRIISACDAFDAMVSTRPHDRARSRPEAIAELRRCAGTQFDPRVVYALCAHLTSPPAPSPDQAPAIRARSLQGDRAYRAPSAG